MGFASCKAFGRSISASLPKPQTPSPWEGAILLGLPPLDQARMLAVRHTKPLHDAVAQMADDLYGGYAPATPFSENTKVYRQTERTGFPVLFLRLNFQPHFFILRQTKHICQLYYIQRENSGGTIYDVRLFFREHKRAL